MRLAVLLLWVLLATGGIAAAVPATAQALPAEIGAEVPVGRNLANDNCRLRRTEAREWGRNAERYTIHCDGWDEPSGMIVRNPGGNRPPPLWLEDSNWILRMQTAGTCEPAVTDPLVEGFSTLLRKCIHREGWRRLALVASAERQMFVADFLPANAPLVERAIMAASNRRPLAAAAPDGTRLADKRALEDLLGPGERLMAAREIGALRDLIRLGNQQQEAREYRKGELTFRRVREVQEQLFGTNSPALANTLHHLTELLRNQRRFDASVTMLERAEPLVRRAADPRDVARQSTLRAGEATRAGDRAAAAGHARAAIAALAGRDRQNPGALSYANYMLMRSLWTNEPGASEAAGRASLRYAIQDGGSDDPYANRARIGLARLLTAQRKFPEARGLVDEALRSSELLYGRSIWWATAKIADGELRLAMGDQGGALAAFRDYAQVAVREPDACYIAPCLPLYLGQLAQLGTGRASGPAFLGEAFQAAQLAESPVLIAAIARLAARQQAGDPALAQATREQQDIEEQQGRIRADLLEELIRKPDERDPAREAQLRSQLQGLFQTAADRSLMLQDRFPAYARLISRQPADVAQVAPLLRPGEALYLYVNTGERGYGLLLWQGRVQMREVPMSAAVLGQRVAALRDGLRTDGRQVTPFDLGLAHALYQDLFGPMLEQNPGIERLLTVTTGPLSSLPLDLLVTEPPRTSDYVGTAWLLKRVAIASLPSVRALLDLRGAAPAPRGTGFFGIGDPVFSGTGATRAVSPEDSCAERRNARAVVASLPALHETAAEVKAIAGSVGGTSKVVLGKQATKAALRGPDIGRADVIAFATHGLLPYELFCDAEPALALSPGTQAEDDGLLRASEISGLRLQASLVILSACNTAAGEGRFGGESLSGLVRAFFFAGSRNVLATHWPIASQATVKLTTGMMQRRDDLTAALRASKLALAQQPDTAHPFFWGAFSLIGGG